jgi:uncharacterized protein YoxC
MIIATQDIPQIRVRPWVVVLCKLLSIPLGVGVLAMVLVWLVSVDICLSVVTQQLLTPDVPSTEIATEESSGTEKGSTEDPVHELQSWRKWEPVTAQWLPGHWQSILYPLLSRDLSTVTPALLMVFLFKIFRGCRHVARKHLGRMLTAEFPFSPTFRLTWVQLGLIGTLWGFLLLGFGLENHGALSDPDLSGQATLNLLIQAFGTALLSTFTAVLLAYLLAPAVQWLFTRSFDRPVDPNVQEVESIEFILWIQKTVQSLKALAEAVDANRGPMVESLEHFGGKVETAADRFESTFAGPSGQFSQMVQEVNKLRGSFGEMASSLDKFLADQRHFQEEDGKRFRIARDGVYGSLGAVKQAVEMLKKDTESRHREMANAIKAQTTILQSIRDNLMDRQTTLTAVRNSVKELGDRVSQIADSRRYIQSWVKKQIRSNEKRLLRLEQGPGVWQRSNRSGLLRRCLKPIAGRLGRFSSRRLGSK